MKIGYVAGFFSTFGIAPQVFKAYKTKDVQALSVYALCSFWVANVLWALHGSNVNDDALILFGTVGIFLNTLLIFAKLKYKKKEKKNKKKRE